MTSWLKGRSGQAIFASPLFGLNHHPRLRHEGPMRLPLLSAVLAPFLLLLPSCVGAPERRPAPSPAVAPAPAPRPMAAPAPATVEWQYRPATPGSWTYSADGAGSSALFAGPGAGAALSLRCDNATRRISFTRAGAGREVMVVRTSYGATSWPATATTSGVEAARAANDATLDQIAYSRGRFAVEVEGLDMLVLPSWAEVGRVVEDCRR
ncbi:MAG TPA: hypothetical protein VF495_08965 [Phenylobacterium sp.]